MQLLEKEIHAWSLRKTAAKKEKAKEAFDLWEEHQNDTQLKDDSFSAFAEEVVHERKVRA